MNNAELVTVTRHNRPKDMEEYVRYYLAIGFDRITIFDNESKYSIKSLFEYNPQVTVIYLPGNYGGADNGYNNRNGVINSFCKERKR